MRKALVAISTIALTVALATPAFACGGLIGPNGAVNLTRTSTLAAWHNGFEHYVTAFKYSGGGGAFGSIVPLPAKPTKVEKGGAWTLQRLERESFPQAFERASATSLAAGGSGAAREIQKVRVDALDLTVLEGGGEAVGIWAKDHGFQLPPDTPAVLDFYAQRSRYFLAAVFDSEAAKKRGQQIGDGTPIHVTIPLAEPWVPLRILGLGKQAQEFIAADVYLLTPRIPNLLPLPGKEYRLEGIIPASELLLKDLKSDRGMEWVPTSGMTLTKISINQSAPTVVHDLAINVHGGQPDARLAGFPPPPTPTPTLAPTPEPTVKPTPKPTPEKLQAFTHPKEPTSSSRGAWPVVALVAVLAASVLAMTLLPTTGPSVKTALIVGAVLLTAAVASASGADAPADRTITLTIEHSKFSSDEIVVERGEKIRFVVRNKDPIDHELIVGPTDVQDAHETGTESWHPPRPGEVSVPLVGEASTTYTFDDDEPVLFACHLPGHWAYGMQGRVTLVDRA